MGLEYNTLPFIGFRAQFSIPLSNILAGFGTFEVKQRAARTGRKPQTGQTMELAAFKKPSFEPGKAVKDALK